MSTGIQTLWSWIETRTGVVGFARRFGSKPIPASAGWPHVLGSVALFLFLMQALTGVLLSLNYSPSPAAAWNSVTYITSKVPEGNVIRGLHHWGSSAMIVVVVAHMTQVFLAGAYRKPREVTWMIGVILLILTCGFGLTGYLLPWDNRGYWGTVVTTQIARNVPGVGPFIAALLGGTHVGAVTLTRFFGLHAIIFPAAAALLIAFHLALVMRHGVSPATTESKPPVPFYPRQAFKDALAVFVCFTLLFAAALLVKVPLERMADPTDLSYEPRPEWYFLFLFELLKFLRGAAETAGTALLPALAILVLVLAPFLDRSRKERITRKSIATGIVLLAFSAWSALTWRALAATSPVNESARGAGIYESNHCGACHSFHGAGGHVGPALDGLASRRDRAWIHRHFLSPQAVVPGSIMPAYRLSEQDELALVDYLTKK